MGMSLDITRIVQKLTAPIARRVRLMARRAVVKLVYDDTKMQTLQVSIMSGEVRDKVERFQDYGFTSVPFGSAEALTLALGGGTDHLVVIRADDRRYRPTGWAKGEAGMYDHRGQVIRLMADGTIRIYGASKVRMECDLEVTGNIAAGGDVSDAAGSMQDMRDVYNGHTHPETGGTTTAPNQEM